MRERVYTKGDVFGLSLQRPRVRGTDSFSGNQTKHRDRDGGGSR